MTHTHEIVNITQSAETATADFRGIDRSGLNISQFLKGHCQCQDPRTRLTHGALGVGVGSNQSKMLAGVSTSQNCDYPATTAGP